MSLCIRFISFIVSLPLSLSQYITCKVYHPINSSLGVIVPNLYILFL